MSTQADVRRYALALPGVIEGSEDFSFSVAAGAKAKGFVWSWKQRVDPKLARVEHPGVIAVRVANQEVKAQLLSADAEKFFTELHYNGYPAVLVRLSAVEPDELEELVIEAWLCMAPKALIAARNEQLGA